MGEVTGTTPHYAALTVTLVTIFLVFGLVLVLAMCQGCWPSGRRKRKDTADPHRLDVHTISNPHAGARELAAAMGKINPVFLKDFDQDSDTGFVIYNPAAITEPAPVHAPPSMARQLQRPPSQSHSQRPTNVRAYQANHRQGLPGQGQRQNNGKSHQADHHQRLPGQGQTQMNVGAYQASQGQRPPPGQGQRPPSGQGQRPPPGQGERQTYVREYNDKQHEDFVFMNNNAQRY